MGELIPTLKPEYATLLQKVELGGKSVREAAEEEGITPNNAAVRLFRARQALKQQLERTCGTCTAHGCLDCSCGSSHKS
jgi:DNA-directed RNA polymerase specialized sigma24 family protein